MSELHDVARKWGVEIAHVPLHCQCGTVHVGARPDLDIAHDLLAKLPMLTCGYEIEFTSDKVSPYWLAKRWDDGKWEVLSSGTFPEAVLALAKRAAP